MDCRSWPDVADTAIVLLVDIQGLVLNLRIFMATKDISDYDCCVAATFGFGNGGSVRTGDALRYRTGQPDKVCERALERAVGRGYLDCGINEWNAFLTDKGRELLECNRLGTTTKTAA